MTDDPLQSIDEDARRRFESGWASGDPEAIEAVLPPPDSDAYLPTLEELVCIELELAWKAGRKPRVEDYLNRFPSLNHPDIVRRLAQEEYRVRGRCGDRPSSEEYVSRFPEVVSSHKDVSNLEETAPSPGARASFSPGLDLGRYSVIAVHARGGFGAVWRARDAKLDREIALKELSSRLSASPGFRTRFTNEARITARLEHPGIVPVYDMADAADDHPYYAMKLLRGVTLEEAIDGMHALPAGSAERRLEERRLLNAFLMACQAMEYAHARDVLHRDLKPQNIILGDYGETVILDWGLAKIVGEGGDEAGDVQVGSTDPQLTQPGTVQGTPAFMSPEQAAGRVELVDPRSDVYALGATLYRLLAGRIPFDGPTSDSVLERVIAAHPARPRSIEPSVHPALEAICLKAMAGPRDARYASVGELTRDLQHHLADEPVAAFAEPIRMRIGRWMRKRRALVTGLAATVLVAVVALGVIAVVLGISAEKERTAKENEREAKEQAQANFKLATAAKEEAQTNLTIAKEERARAEGNFRMAKEAVDRFYTEVSDDRLLRSAGFENLRKSLLRSAGEFYRRFATQKADNPRLKQERGWALQRLAEIIADTESPKKALDAYREARDIFAKLFDKHPTDALHLRNLADSNNLVARMLVRLNDYDEAEKTFRKALDLYDRALAASGGNREIASERAMVLNNLGTMCDNVGRFKESERLYAEAVAVKRGLAERFPEDRVYRHHLATTLLNMGVVNDLLNRPEKAVAAYREIIELTDQLIRKVPDEPDYPVLMATAQHNLGKVLRGMKKLDEAEKLYGQALATRERLVKDHPGATRFLHELATTLSNLGVLKSRRGDYDGARALYRRATKIRKQLIELQPDVPLNRYAVAGLQLNMGFVAMYERDWERARDAFDRASQGYDVLVKRFPDNTAYAAEASSAHVQVAQALANLKQEAQALPRLDKADTILTGLLERAPRLAAARHNMMVCLQYKAELFNVLGRYREAADAWTRSVEFQPDNRVYLEYQAANSLALAGDHESGLPVAAEIAKAGEKDPQLAYNAALLYDVLAKATAEDVGLTAAKKKVKIEDLQTRAIRCLENARQLDFFRDPENLNKLRGNFGHWRARPDFRALIDRLRAK